MLSGWKQLRRYRKFQIFHLSDIIDVVLDDTEENGKKSQLVNLIPVVLN